MRNECIARRRNCKPVLAVAPDGTLIKCFSMARAAQLSGLTVGTVRKSIREDKAVRSGWRFTLGR